MNKVALGVSPVHSSEQKKHGPDAHAPCFANSPIEVMHASINSPFSPADESDMSASTLAFKSSSTTTSPDIQDRRRSERTPRVLDAWICSPTAADPLEEREEVTAVSLSRHGVAFTLAHTVATGTFYLIEVALGAQEVVSEVRIISCRRTDQGLFEVGAEFC